LYEHFVKGQSLAEVYHQALLELHRGNIELPCPNYNTLQKEASMTFVVENALKEPMISRLFTGDARALEQYRQEFLYGILDFEIARGNWEYTYHDRFKDQLPWLIQHLKTDMYSRQAVLHVAAPSDMETNSPACLQEIQFMFRDGRLHCKVVFRSNDAPKAAFMNAYAIIRLQEAIANELGVPVGSYTHRANSFHVYKQDYETFDNYVKAIIDGRNITYNYEGDWDDQMEESKPLIADMVEKQRAKLC